MACATLKRPLDFDPLLHDHHHKSPKRQRCAPMAVSPTPPSAATSTLASTSKANPNSPFGEVKPAMTNVVIAAKLQAEFRRMQRRKEIKAYHRSRRDQGDSSSGSDSEPEMMTATSSAAAAALFSTSAKSATTSKDTADDVVMPSSPDATAKNQDDKPLFNFKQVSLICERLVREREEALREEYDKVLSEKLAEQYDAFVKFTYDQIQRRLNDRPMSYVS